MNRLLTVVVLGLMSFGVAGARWLDKPEKLEPQRKMGFAAAVPQSIAGWQQQHSRDPGDSPEALDINELFQAIYRHPEFGRLALTLEYTSDSRRRFELHYPDVCHRIRGDRVIEYPKRLISLPEQKSVSSALIEWRHPSGEFKALASYWYITKGGVTTETGKLKFNQFVAGVLSRPEAAVMVRVDAFFDEPLDPGSRKRLITTVDEMIRQFHGVLDTRMQEVLFEQI